MSNNMTPLKYRYVVMMNTVASFTQHIDLDFFLHLHLFSKPKLPPPPARHNIIFALLGQSQCFKTFSIPSDTFGTEFFIFTHFKIIITIVID